MAIPLPSSVKQVIADQAYGHVLTYNSDGSPQLTMVWMDIVGNHPCFNTAEGRIKVRNLMQDSRIVISVQDRNHPEAYILLYGTARIGAEGADEQADKLAKRFLGLAEYPYREPGVARLIVQIDVERISGANAKGEPWA